VEGGDVAIERGGVDGHRGSRTWQHFGGIWELLSSSGPREALLSMRALDGGWQSPFSKELPPRSQVEGQVRESFARAKSSAFQTLRSPRRRSIFNWRTAATSCYAGTDWEGAVSVLA